MNKSKAIALKVRCKFAALLCVVMLLTSLLPTFSIAFAADRRTRSTVCTDAQGNRYAVSVRYTSGANIPDDAELTVREISPDEEAYGAYLEHTEAVLCGENETLNNARFLDISLVSHEDPTVQYQPADGAKVQVHIQLETAPQRELSVVHFAEEAPPEVLSNTVKGDTLQFETTGFSVYAIVDAPESNNTNFGDVETEATGLDGSGFYLGAGKSERVLYWMRTGTVRTSNAGVVINRTVANDPTLAEMYYFQRVPGDQEQYYLYYKDDQGGFHYVKLTGETNAEFVSSAANATAFSIESCGSDGPNRFYLSFKQGGTTYYLNLRKGDAGQGFSGSTYGKPQKDKGSMIYLCKRFTQADDPYDLDGKTTGIILMKSSTDLNVVELTNTALNGSALTAKDQPMKGNPLDPDQPLIYADGDLSQWTFESIGGKEYYLKTTVDGQTKYLRLTETGAMLVDTPDNNCKITVTVGTGSNAGKYRFSCTESGTSLALNNGGTANGFGVTTSTGSANAWFKLADLSVLQEDDLVSYVAKKVSISDRSRIKNGSKVVIYYRMWNESTKKYDFYALDHDGSLVYLYDEGDTLRWTGSQINSLLWDFTEYYYWFTNIPNGYYELQNEYSGKYLAPQINGSQILSDSPVGINLTGRRHGEVDSTILAWDNRYYDYAALKTDGDHVESVPMSQGERFYFAVMDYDANTLHEVDTVDNTEFGIKMKLIKYPRELTYANSSSGGGRNHLQTDVLGEDTAYVTELKLPSRDLVTTDLNENGYPVATHTGRSLEELFGNATDANHLFYQQVYDESGYFEYNSTLTFASYDNVGGDFTVYNELCTAEVNTNSQGHSQFLPYNDIDTSRVSQFVNFTDVYNVNLPLNHPRRGEQMYSVPVRETNYHFGMEMEASFVQSPDGLDAWGHDLVFEFAGDDDMWLYVDGELVLDLGGIHSALVGKINFHTGEVTIPSDTVIGGSTLTSIKTTTLRQLFKENYLKRNPNATADEVNEYLDRYFEDGGTVFKSYTAHTMKMFYMERGAGASNLIMRFNLSTMSNGQLLLGKEVSGTDKQDYASAVFPFQIYYWDPNYTEGDETGSGDGTGTGQGTGSGDGTGTGGETGSGDGTGTGGETGSGDGTGTGGETGSGDGTGTGDGTGEGDDTQTPTGAWRLVTRLEELQGSDIYSYLGATSVNYENTNTPVAYADTYEAAPNVVYENVFFLKPGERADIHFPSDETQYRIQECAVNGSIYDQVKSNDTILLANNVEGTTLSDYITDPDVVGQRKVVKFDNHVSENALRTLLVTKRLYDEQGRELTRAEDDTGFKFRMYIGNEDSFDDLNYYSLDSYYVKDPNGCYCIFDPDDGFVSTGETDFEELSETQKARATFNTSPSGAIDLIPAQYSIEIRNLLIGTKFKVIEQNSDIPHGYDFVEYERDGNSYISEEEPNMGTIRDINNPHVTVKNCRGWGLTVEKSWSDDSFMASHDNIYFAVYCNGVLLPDTVRRMHTEVNAEYPGGENSIYYFFKQLQENTTFSDYTVREVLLENPVVDTTGKVTSYDSITPLAENGTLPNEGGVLAEDQSRVSYNYSVHYTPGTPTQDTPNVRTDHVSNDRPGLRIVKTDMNGVPLENATFTLTESGESVGANSYVSGSDGLVTIAYLNKNTPYTLTETAAPQNYIALMDQITLTIDNNDIVTVGNAPAGDIVTVDYNDPSGMTTVKIKNCPTGFKFEKVTAETDQSGVHTPLSGAHFALYPEVVTWDGTRRKHYYPLSGYEDIVSDASGELSGLTDALTPGSYYYLTETQAPANYMQLTGDIRFTINERGELVIDDESYAAWLTTTTENGTLVQTFSIQNERLEQVMIFKKDSKTGTALAGAEFALYAAADFDDSTDTPLANAEPVRTGETGSNGLLPLGNLPRGSYRLVETKAPLGYFAPEHALPIEVTENSITITQNGVTRTATTGTGGMRILDVTNVLAIELPATGGSGPLLIYAGGFFLLLIVGAALIWLRRRRAAEGVQAV